MRLRKRLSAAILAIVVIVSSVQIPGGTAHAAQMAGSGVESGQESAILTAEGTEGAETAGEDITQPSDSAVTDDGDQKGDEAPAIGDEGQTGDDTSAGEGGGQTGSDNATVDDSQTDDDTSAGEGGQTGGDNLTGDDDQTDGDHSAGDTSQPGDDTQAGDDADAEDETDAISGNDIDKSVLGAEEEADDGILTAGSVSSTCQISGAYQFGDAPADGGIMVLSATDNGNVAEAQAYLYEKMLAYEEEISLSAYNIPVEGLSALVSGVLNEHPDLYFVNKKYSVTHGTMDDEGTAYVASVKMSYDTSYDNDAFQNKVSAALACVSDGMGDSAKAAALHDWLAVNIMYDYDNFEAGTVPTVSHNAYGALVNGTAVCDGYALAYKYLLSNAGIESYMVTSESMAHVWNMVNLDGEYYHVDVTFDDPVPDIVGKAAHTNLFCSDTNLENHSDWTVTSGSSGVDYRATSDKYANAFWKDSNAPLVFSEGDCYYIDKSGKIRKAVWQNTATAGTEIVNIGKTWEYDSVYSGLYMIDGRLFYNTPTTICSVKTDGTDKKTEFTAESKDGYQIYGSAYRGGEVLYVLRTGPNQSDTGEILTAEIGVDEPDPPEETKSGYQVDNLSDAELQEYAAVNVLNSSGSTIPRANGKPVALIFYNSSSASAGLSTLQSVSEHADYFKNGVEFYTVDTNFSGTEDTIKSLVEDNGLSTTLINWLFMYQSYPLMNEYIGKISDYSSVTGRTYPFIVYIDADNKIQYAAEGSLTAEEILASLRQYCGYTRYRVTYHMDGGENSSNNPDTYTSTDTDITLAYPLYREGYRFAGWYKDSQYTKRVTKIAAGSKNDITLYAKWVEGAFNLANLTQEYQTLDDTNVNSTADGKPKVLIFFKEGDAACLSTLGSIDSVLRFGADDHVLFGIDLYAIETYQAAKDALTGKYEEYRGFTFCYDDTTGNRRKMNAYAEAAGFSLYSDIGLPDCPVICYIDKDNRLQYVSAGQCNVDTIIGNLQTYCKYPSAGETYTITYVLDGGANGSGNPESYTGAAAVALNPATKEGYVFAGWYTDAAYTEEVTEIARGTTGDITLYAKWRKEAADLTDTTNFDYTFTTLDGQKVSSKADGKPKILYFISETAANCQQTHKDLSNHIKAFEGIDIYAVSSAKDKDTVIAFKDQYGCDGITYCYDDGSDTVTNIRKAYNYATKKSGSNSAKSNVIVFIDEENSVQYIYNDHAATTWTELFVYLQDYCGYNRYYIDYELNDGVNNSENPFSYQGGTQAIALKDPTKGKDQFDGWYLDQEYEQPVTEIPEGSRGNITLYAKWTKMGTGLTTTNLDYTFTTIDGGTVSTKADGKPKLLVLFLTTCPRTMKTTKSISDYIRFFAGVDICAVAAYNRGTAEASMQESTTAYKEAYGCDEMAFGYSAYNSYMYEYAEKVGVDDVYTPVVAYIDADNYLQHVTVGETNTWDEVFENLQTYCDYDCYRIHYELDGGTNDSENPEMYTSTQETVTLKDAAKDGFVFEGWYEDGAFEKQVTEISTGSTGNITLYAKWGRSDSGFGLDNLDQTYTGLDETTLSSKADGKPKLLVFFYGDESEASLNTIKNITEIISSLDGVDVYAIESYGKNKNNVTIFKDTYGCDGITFAYDNPNKYFPETMNCRKAGNYLKAVELPTTSIGRPEDSAYPVLCYIDKDNKLQWVTTMQQTGEQILGNLKQYCDYEAPVEETYQITYELDGGTNNSENPEIYTEATETITLKDPVKEGYTFEGWYKDAEFTEQVEEIAKGSTGDITLYAKWKEEALEPGTYRITYELNGGTNSDENPATYTEETDTIILKDAVREGYVFEGWYKDAEFTEQVKEITKGSTGDITLYARWKAADAILTVTSPDRTTYKVGEELDVTGGKVILTSSADESIKEEKDMTADMLEGFDSSQPGICTVTVTCDGYTGSFDALIVEEPELRVPYGKTLGSVEFPACEYGTYAWAESVETDSVVKEAGTYDAVFTPNDMEKFQMLELQITVALVQELTQENTEIEYLDGPYIYKKESIHPKIKVTFTGEDGEPIELVEGQDYERDEDQDGDNIVASGWVYIEGINGYTGNITQLFTIDPKILTVRAKDKVICVGDPLPDPKKDYEYEADEPYEGDEQFVAFESLVSFACDITDTSQEGEYEIRVSYPYLFPLEDCYRVRCESGTLYVVSELVTHQVTFDVQGHGTAPKTYTGIAVGATIDSPEEPTAEGYRFDGWYKDAACTKAWDFETDTVQADLTLYAKWLGVDSDGEFAVQEIADVTYNGKAQKPAISVYDDDTLLKAGRDYTIKYYNNINANAGGVLKGDTFNGSLPYAAITGKGNYKEIVKINFNILPASIGDGEGNPAAGVALKINDHLVKSTGVQKPFKSIKKGRSLKEGTDYELILRADMAYNSSGGILLGEKLDRAEIPANYSGEFRLTVKGKGNYEGGITRTVYVATDKAHQMKNVTIKFGGNVKKGITYTGSAIKLNAVENARPGDNEFAVMYGRTVLKPNEDYYVLSENNVSAGKAQIIVIGKGEKDGYTGRKTATFNIKGRAFTGGTVSVTGLEGSRAYTGKAAVQNKNVKLTWKDGSKELVYGQDYTISYTKNVNKGTATMTFTGLASAGYSGKFSKKFKISAANIADEGQVTRDASMQTITMPYSKAGAKPVDEIILTNAAGIRLKNGRDYTLSYKNNKAVADTAARKAPTVTVKGKGNYTGSFEVKYTITKADLRGEAITIECAQIAYNGTKADRTLYTPAVKVKDGNKALKEGTDYEVAYVKNTKGDYDAYRAKLSDGTVTDEDIPRAVITEKAGSAYTLLGEIAVPLQVYMTKLTKNNLSVQIDGNTAVYTGGQVRPKVTVAYRGENGNITLVEGVHYTLAYGANNKAGKNKGSVTIKGLAPEYGGSVTYKFEIIRKGLKYWFWSVNGDEK